MPIPIFVVDAFAESPLEGNPAGVCLLEKEASAEWMQKVAEEMKHAETAFIWPIGDDFGLRWFTPTVEVSLCGHATLASAQVLFEERNIQKEEITFHTASGELHCKRGEDHTVVMDFPAKPPAPYGSPSLKTISHALGIKDEPVDVLAYGLDWFIVFENQAQVEAIQPDFLEIISLGLRGVLVTAPANPGEFDFVSRFFAPSSGIPEDFVTGSAHCALAPYWSRRLGKTKMKGRQLSARRGTVGVEWIEDRVFLTGHAQVVLAGELRL